MEVKLSITQARELLFNYIKQKGLSFENVLYDLIDYIQDYELDDFITKLLKENSNV